MMMHESWQMEAWTPFFVMGLIALALFALWIWAIVDAVRSEFKDPTAKIVWILLLIFLSGLGLILYLIFGKGTKISGESL